MAQAENSAQQMRPLGVVADSPSPSSLETRAERERRLLPRRFMLFRDVDETGISGTGIVAVGVQFRKTGQCFMEWVTPNTPPTWGVYNGVYSLQQVHGHNGKTRILWPDDECTAACRFERGDGDNANLVLQCCGNPGHTGDHGDQQTGFRWDDTARGAIPALPVIPERVIELERRERHLYDVYHALGINYGEDPFTAIAKLRGYKDGVLP